MRIRTMTDAPATAVLRPMLQRYMERGQMHERIVWRIHWTTGSKENLASPWFRSRKDAELMALRCGAECVETAKGRAA